MRHPGARKPRPNRSGHFAALTLSAGAVAAVAALLGVWPFGGLQAIVTHAFHPPAAASPLEAQLLFPPVGPVHKVVDVYDPAPQAAPPPAGGGASAGGNFPVINFPAGPMSAIEATCETAKQAAETQSESYKQNVERQCEAAKQAYEQSHP